MKKLSNIILNEIYYIILLLFACLLIPIFTSFADFNFSENTTDAVIYFLLCFIILLIIGIFGIIKYIKEHKIKQLVFLIVLILAIFFVIVCFANTEVGDYLTFLEKWYNEYQNGTLKEDLYKIIDVSNYTPAYNYILIFLAKIGANSLYSIKFVTFLFSLLLAFSVEKIINQIKKDKFNYLRFFVILALPPILVEYSLWGQCDAIYTSFAMLAFLFALKKKSKLSFMFVGLSFAFKLQFLFVVPILFVMLIIKDENGEHYLKWKDIYIAPLMYLINLIPVFAGRPIDELLLVYLNQSVYDNRISGNCANICFLYYYNNVSYGQTIYNVLTIIHVILTFLVIGFYLFVIFKLNKRHRLSAKDLVFFGMAFSFSMVFFMPKMLDRFYFISFCFSFIYMLIDRSTKSKYYFVLILNSLFLMMVLHFLISSSFYLGIISAFVVQILLFFDIIKILVNKNGRDEQTIKIEETEKVDTLN